MSTGRLEDAIEIPVCDVLGETLAAAARALATARAELGLPSSARVRRYAPAAAMRWRRSALGRPFQPFEVQRSF